MNLSLKKYFIKGEASQKIMVDILKVLLGSSLLGLANSKWMVPNQIINGGVTSLSLILEKATGINVAVNTQVLTVLFLVLSFIFLGSKNVLLSLVSSISYTSFFSLFYKASFSLQINIVVDIILACLVIALGYYFCISAGGSTVGVEVIALIIHKKYAQYDLIKLMRLMNYSVLVAGLFVFGFKSVIVGVIFSYGYSALLKEFMRKRGSHT